MEQERKMKKTIKFKDLKAKPEVIGFAGQLYVFLKQYGKDNLELFYQESENAEITKADLNELIQKLVLEEEEKETYKELYLKQQPTVDKLMNRNEELFDEVQKLSHLRDNK